MKRHLKTIALCLVCIIVLIFGLFVKKKQTPILKIDGYKQILELWHIDSFEGGIGSRRDFLSSCAVSFEKQNKVIVSVVTHSLESASEALKSTVPDMISCGNGLDIASLLLPLSLSCDYEVCSYGNKNYGVAWARGVYALIGSGEKKNLIVSQSEFTQPLVALEKAKIVFDNIEVLSPSKAYSEYLRKGGYLLGTQRDIYRLLNRGVEVEYQPIGEYSDLFQVIGVTSKNKEKVAFCEGYILHLLSDGVQKNLTKIGLMSTTGIKLYKGEVIQKLEELQIKEFTSFLTSPQNLKQMQTDSLNNLGIQG